MNIHKITADYLSILAVRRDNKRNLAAAYICNGLDGIAKHLKENIFMAECYISGDEKSGHLPILTAYYDEICYDFDFFINRALAIKKVLIDTENDIDLFSRETIDKMFFSTAMKDYPGLGEMLRHIPVSLLSPELILAAKRSEDTGWMLESVIGNALVDSVLSPADVIRYALVGQCLI